MTSIARGEDEQIQSILSASQSREKESGQTFYVEWKVEERIRPGVLDQLPEDRRDGNALDADLVLARTNFFAWDGAVWRYDSVGRQLHRDDPSAAFQSVDQHVVHVQRSGEVREFFGDAQDALRNRGQIFATPFNSDDAHLNDVANLPIALFVRPSHATLFRKIAEGRFEILPDPPQRPDVVNEVCVRDKRFHGKTACFLAEEGHVCTRMQMGPRMTLEIEYSEFEGFGFAPKSWTCTQLLEDGHVGRVWTATVIQWHKRRDEILSLLAFDFPEGTKVTDVDRTRRLIAAADGALRPDESNAPTRSSWGLFVLLINVFAVVALIALVLVRRMRRARLLKL